MAGGFEVRSLRIKNEGEISQEYKIISLMTSGNNEVYKIKIYRNWEVLFDGLLSEVRLEVKDKLEVDDLLMVVSLGGGEENLGDEVGFNLIFVSLGSDSGGFVVKRVLKNLIVTAKVD